MSLYSGNNIGGAPWNTTQDQQAILMQQMYANYMTQYVQYLQVNLFFKKTLTQYKYSRTESS